MLLPSWPKAPRIGIAALDDDHRLMLEFAAALGRASCARQRHLALAAAENLIMLARAHFRREEELLVACRFPKADAHRRGHRAFLADLDAVALAIAHDQWRPAEGRLIQALRLLETRLLREDAECGRWVAGKGLTAAYQEGGFVGLVRSPR